MTNQMIPDEAVRAASFALYEEPHINGVGMADIRAALEAAAPHMLTTAWDKGHERGFWNGRMSQVGVPYDAPDPLIGKKDAEANNPYMPAKASPSAEFDPSAPLPPLTPLQRNRSWEPAARRYRDLEPDEHDTNERDER